MIVYYFGEKFTTLVANAKCKYNIFSLVEYSNVDIQVNLISLRICAN